MVKNYKSPNLNGPRYRKKTLGFLNKETFDEFKKTYPVYANIDDDKLRQIIRLYNEALWNGVIEHREGVELPNSLGYLFIGTCPPAKGSNIDFAKSKEYGKTLKNKNWETDGNVAKIFYTNWNTKYKFKNRNLWSFKASRRFKRAVSAAYRENWSKYIKMRRQSKVSQVYDPNPDKTEKDLLNYNEFDL